MKNASSGMRGVYWRSKLNGGQTFRTPVGDRINGDWWIRWKCSFGHLHRELIGPKALAEQEYHRRKTEARRESFCPSRVKNVRPLLFRDAGKEYLAWARENKRSWSNDEYRMRQLTNIFGNMLLDDITAVDVERVKATYAAQYSPATVNRVLALMKHLFNRAKRDGKVAGNPVTAVRLFVENNQRVRWLNYDEEQRLFALIPEPYRGLCVVAVNTGLRKGDLLGLHWKNIDFQSGSLTVERAKNGEMRRLPINSLVRNTFRQLPRNLSETRVFPACGEISHKFSTWAAQAGLEDLHFHDLRHTFASRLAMAGEQLLTIKELMGHKTIQMTLRYSHLSPDHKKQAVERLVPKTTDVGYKQA